jgi:hypothetical protein
MSGVRFPLQKALPGAQQDFIRKPMFEQLRVASSIFYGTTEAAVPFSKTEFSRRLFRPLYRMP